MRTLTDRELKMFVNLLHMRTLTIEN
jgi:hypothetical protein